MSSDRVGEAMRWDGPPRLPASALDLRPLYYFAFVAHHGSFSHASSVLSVSQPILSRTIKALEAALGVQLLYRNGRGVVTTDAGSILLEHSTDIFRKLARADAEVTALRGVATGEVVMALPPLLGGLLTVGLVRRMQAEYPGVRISLREGFAAESLEWLSGGVVDLAIMFNPPHVTTLVTEHIVDDSLHLVGTSTGMDVLPGTPIEMNELTSLSLILPPRPQRLRSIIESGASEARVDLNVVIEATGTLTVLELVRKRVGYTILPSLLVREECTEGRLASWPIVVPVVSTHLFAVTSMQRPQTLATKAVLRAARQTFAETLTA